MKFKLLGVNTEHVVNIGDYIQALAASQFLPTIDGFIQRENLRDYKGEECKIIMNGWFMHNPVQWPPSEKIHPLFVSFHLNTLAKETLTNPQSIAYFKRFEPIGCRDIYTRDLLQSYGVEAYFSGCLTLTLGRKYKSESRENEVYFVDPYFATKRSINNILKNICSLLLHYRTISAIAKKYPSEKKGIRKKMKLVTFFREYRKYFSDEVLKNATYICHQSVYYKNNFPDDKALLSEAERLVRLYSKAKLVVTSRIHCALPCLGLETPVIYIEKTKQNSANSCRMGGIAELFTTMQWSKGGLYANFDRKGKISLTENIPSNKNTWRNLASKLIDIVKERLLNDK